MSRIQRRLAIISWMLTAFGCVSSHGPKVGTGDVSFRVVWQGVSDLDLYVVDPKGEHLSHQRRTSVTGGILDVDCNGDDVCDDPVENVYWPLGQAPPGVYRVWVRAHRLQEGESPLQARLLILRGGEVMWEQSTAFTRRAEILGPFAYWYGADSRSEPDIYERPGWIGAWACMTERTFIGGLNHALFLDAENSELSSLEPRQEAVPLSNVEVQGSALSFVVVGEGGWTATFQGQVDGEILTGDYSPTGSPVVPVTCVSIGPPRHRSL